MDARDLMRELADRLERTANVRAVFGAPIGEGQDMVIPVARVSVRGGGGSGGSDEPSGEAAGDRKGKGMGLGLNITTSPVGYIKQTQDGPVFVPVIDMNRIAVVALAVMGLGLVLGKVMWRKSRG